MSLILVGDFGQLPPVMDTILWKKKHEKECLQGFNLYRTFDQHINLSKVMRQDDPKFLNLLNRIRNGKITESDWETLKKRNPDILKKLPEDYDSILRLFPRNQTVFNYNINQLRKLSNKKIPVVKCVADHLGNKKAQNASVKDMWGLHPVVWLCQQAEVMLNQNLLPAIYGLVNGSRVKVIDILFDENTKDMTMPYVVIVDFPDYKGPQFFKNHPTYVPIPPFTAMNTKRKIPYTRIQIPLNLAFAITIHKSQGLTLKRAVVDLEKSENSEGGLTYVALSRLKTLDGLFLVQPSWKRLKQINDRVMIKKRIKEEKRLRNKCKVR